LTVEVIVAGALQQIEETEKRRRRRRRGRRSGSKAGVSAVFYV
jgi:hypothetical protein